MFNLLWRNMKWRYQNLISVVVTILQPLIWLVLYSLVASQSMQNAGINNYTAFILPGIIVLVTMSACISSGFLNFIMKTNGSYYRILIAPVSRVSIVLGQLLEAVILTLLETVFLCVIAFFLSAKVASGFIGCIIIILIVFMVAFSVSGVAYSISLFMPNEIVYETLMTAVVLPIFFLSPALFPMESFSRGIKSVIIFNPFTHVINSLRSLINQELIEFNEMLPVIGMLAVLCIGSYFLAVWALNRQMSS